MRRTKRSAAVEPRPPGLGVARPVLHAAEALAEEDPPALSIREQLDPVAADHCLGEVAPRRPSRVGRAEQLEDHAHVAARRDREQLAQARHAHVLREPAPQRRPLSIAQPLDLPRAPAAERRQLPAREQARLVGELVVERDLPLPAHGAPEEGARLVIVLALDPRVDGEQPARAARDVAHLARRDEERVADRGAAQPIAAERRPAQHHAPAARIELAQLLDHALAVVPARTHRRALVGDQRREQRRLERGPARRPRGVAQPRELARREPLQDGDGAHRRPYRPSPTDPGRGPCTDM